MDDGVALGVVFDGTKTLVWLLERHFLVERGTAAARLLSFSSFYSAGNGPASQRQDIF